MIRALYTAASGMSAQQQNIDNVAHNLANVNTTGFKKARVEFEDLVYDQTRVPGSPTSTTAEAPIGLETGLGVRAVATSRDFSRGNLKATSGPLDLAIEGDGFFQIQMPSGDIGYTRAGSFHLTGEGTMVTSDGYPVEPQIQIPPNATSISISKDGVVSVAIPGQAARAAGRHTRARLVPESGGSPRERRQHLPAVDAPPAIRRSARRAKTAAA